MYRFFLTVFCLGVLALAESKKDCKGFISEETSDKLREAKYLPEKEVLDEACPEYIAYMECIEEEAPLLLEPIEFFHGVKGIINDVCEEDSDLQTAYLSSVACVKNEMEQLKSCSNAGYDMYNEFQQFENSTKGDILESVSNSERHCMSDTFGLACAGIEILLKCGEVAHNTFVEVLRRSQVFNMICQPNDILRIKSAFLEFLTMENHPIVDIILSLMDRKK